MGSTRSFYCACLALLDPGDEVILFEQYYGYHLNTLLAVDAVPKYVTMKFPALSFSRDDLERVVTKKQRGLWYARQEILQVRCFLKKILGQLQNLLLTTTSLFLQMRFMNILYLLTFLILVRVPFGK